MFSAFQLYLEAYDKARPNNRAKVLLVIFVNRNPNSPVMPASQLFIVNERDPVGFNITRFVATDNDVINYLDELSCDDI